MPIAFDEKSHVRRFREPSSTHVADCIRGSDEAGFLYDKELARDGETVVRPNRGSNDYCCKDALISLLVRRRK